MSVAASLLHLLTSIIGKNDNCSYVLTSIHGLARMRSLFRTVTANLDTFPSKRPINKTLRRVVLCGCIGCMPTSGDEELYKNLNCLLGDDCVVESGTDIYHCGCTRRFWNGLFSG